MVAAVAAEHQGLAGRAVERVEDRLDEVLQVVRLLEDGDLLAQARGAGLLTGERGGGDDTHRCGTVPIRRERRCARHVARPARSAVSSDSDHDGAMKVERRVDEASGLDALALLDQLPEMVVVIAADLTVKFVNQRLLDVMGYERAAVIGTNLFDYVHPDDQEYMAMAWAERAANPGETGMLIEGRGRNADGTWRGVEIYGRSLIGDGVIDGLVMTLRDVRRQGEEGYDAGRIRSMLERTTDVVLLLDRDGRICYANRRLTSSLGVDQDEVVGATFTSLVLAAEHPRFEQWFAQLAVAGDVADAGIRLLVERGEASGVARTIEWHGTNQLDDPLIAGLILSGRDVTDLVEMERRIQAQTEQLRHSARHDALTGLLNRSAFVEEIGEQIAGRRAGADDGDLVVLFCDLDRFKSVNDAHGHAAGDHVLQVAGERLRRCLRDGDVVARWGGDEFTVVLRGSPPPDAVAELVDRLRQRLERADRRRHTDAGGGGDRRRQPRSGRGRRRTRTAERRRRGDVRPEAHSEIAAPGAPSVADQRSATVTGPSAGTRRPQPPARRAPDLGTAPLIDLVTTPAPNRTIHLGRVRPASARYGDRRCRTESVDSLWHSTSAFGPGSRV